MKYALTIAGKINEETFRVAFKKKGLNENPSLMEASMAQRLAFGSRLNEIVLRRTNTRDNKDDFAPEIKSKEILLSGEVERNTNAGSPSDGMVVAQGNKADGYALFVLNNRLHFQVNQKGKAYKIVTSEELPANFSFKAGIEKNGTMRLYIDDKEAGAAKGAGLFTKDVEAPIRIGVENQDGNNKIANYPDSAFMVKGNLKVRLETLDGTLPDLKQLLKLIS